MREQPESGQALKVANFCLILAEVKLVIGQLWLRQIASTIEECLLALCKLWTSMHL